VRVYLPAVSGSDLASAWRAEGQLSAEQGPGCCRRMPSSSDSCGAYSRRSGPVMTCPRLLTFTNVYSAMLGIGTFCDDRGCCQLTVCSALQASGAASAAARGCDSWMTHWHLGWEAHSCSAPS